MNPGEPQAFEDPDAEVESFRKILEARLEEEKVLLEEEREGALGRIKELEEQSIAKAEKEWTEYEETLLSSGDSFIKDLRSKMTSLLDPLLEKMATEMFVEKSVKEILPSEVRDSRGGQAF
jgi:hypothetical protein